MSEPIAIDTNIFLHLFNEENNPDSHIDQLLSQLAKKDYRLCVDSTNKIVNEYVEYIHPIIKNNDEDKFQIPLLRFWMDNNRHDQVALDSEGILMRRIKEVVVENDEHADRAFIYVACAGNCCLATNDGIHILNRRPELKSKTRKLRGEKTIILSSKEAVTYFTKAVLTE